MTKANLSRTHTYQQERVRWPSNSFCFGRSLEGDLDVETSVCRRIVHQGERLYHIGDAFKGLFLLLSGHVKTVMTTEDGEEQIIGFFGPGDSLGADGYAAGSYPVDAIALDTLGVHVVDIDTLLRNRKNAAETQKNLLKLFSQAIVTSDQHLVARIKLNAEQRVAQFLIDHSRAQTRRGCSPTRFTLPMTRRDIGNYLNLAFETISRVLTHFSRVGLIRYNRNEVEWLDLDALADTLCSDDAPRRALWRSSAYAVDSARLYVSAPAVVGR